MWNSPFIRLACAALASAAMPVLGNFHLWQLTEAYSNADGSVQFIELTALTGGQQFLTGHTLKATSGSESRSLVFPSDLPGDTTGKKFLVGTSGYAALGGVAPDYVMPNGFVFIAGGTINFADVDIWVHGPLPTDGVLSLQRNGTTATNSTTNFAGTTGQVTLPSYMLSVTRAGSGSGTVTSAPAGINCGATCAASFASGTPVTLTAGAASGSVFVGWSGPDCPGTGACSVNVSAPTAVTATFTPPEGVPRLANISTRGQVLTGNDVMIAGFVIQGEAAKTVVVRARGPSLVPFGITNALANPTLQLVRSSDQVTIATNDNWVSASNSAAISASGFAPSNSLESAILVTLAPGAYTAIVSGFGGGTGVGIVEVFITP